jgi:ribonuclease HII
VGPTSIRVLPGMVARSVNARPDVGTSPSLSAEQREAAFAVIMGLARSVSVASVSAQSIDGSDIRKASLEAMRRAVAGLCTRPLLVLADGRDMPPGLDCSCRALVGGDGLSVSIAAASIVAKVMRDRIMCRAGACDDRYGFESHMGYATRRHQAAIELHGAVARLHRLSFAPFRVVAAE